MSRIVPVDYILTDEAINEIVGADSHCRRLNAEWRAALGNAKSKAYDAVIKRQNQITDALFEAVTEGELPAIALKRMPSGEWSEHSIPSHYLETFGGHLGLWTGSVERLDLEPSDRWISDSPLCFRRSEFNRWRVTAVVLGPGPQYLATLWTVPQAAVWIVTRDLSKVQSLDGRARAWLCVADEVIRGTFAASFDLLAGLRDGRLIASGWSRGQQLSGIGEPIQSNFWRAPTEFSDGETGVEAVRGLGDAMVGLLLESDEVMAKWESPQSLLDNEKVSLGVAIGRLAKEDLPRYLLQHPEVKATGLNDRGERVEIDKDVFRANAVVDRAAHSVKTPDGRLHWSAVMLEFRAAPAHLAEASPVTAPGVQASLPPSVGEREALAWVKGIIDRIVADKRQLRRSDFDAMLRQQYEDRLAPKMEERLWQQATPDDWRRPKQGRLPESKVVNDWRFYAKATAREKGSNPPSKNTL
jgi:hypothetical protein